MIMSVSHRSSSNTQPGSTSHATTLALHAAGIALLRTELPVLDKASPAINRLRKCRTPSSCPCPPLVHPLPSSSRSSSCSSSKTPPLARAPSSERSTNSSSRPRRLSPNTSKPSLLSRARAMNAGSFAAARGAVGVDPAWPPLLAAVVPWAAEAGCWDVAGR